MIKEDRPSQEEAHYPVLIRRLFNISGEGGAPGLRIGNVTAPVYSSPNLMFQTVVGEWCRAGCIMELLLQTGVLTLSKRHAFRYHGLL